MANKTRRRKKATEGEPFSRVKAREQAEKVVTSKRRREQIMALIEQHCDKAGHLTREAERVAKLGRYGEAGKLLREASNYLHLANAEARKLPPAANVVQDAL